MGAGRGWGLQCRLLEKVLFFAGQGFGCAGEYQLYCESSTGLMGLCPSLLTPLPSEFLLLICFLIFDKSLGL